MKRLAMILVIVGAINWGLIGAFGVDLLGNVFSLSILIGRGLDHNLNDKF